MIYLSPPNVGEEEIKNVSNVLKSGWVAPVGNAIDEFEHSLSNHFHGKSILAVNSGTSALHLALILAGVKDGDDVLVSSFTFAACANVIRYERANPVFIDSEADTWNLDPELLEKYLANANKIPKALIVTHLFGMPAKIKRICEIARRYKIKVIEDAAEALGSKVDDKQVGGFGDFGILSFNGNKIITTSTGGGLICSNEDKERGKHLATQANSGVNGYDHKDVGYNYRMSNVLAGIGLSQLRKLALFIERKLTIYERYKNELSEVIEFGPESKYFSNRWLTTGQTRVGEASALIEALSKENIECREVWKPLHLHDAYKSFPFYGDGICEQVFNRGICLPSGTSLNAEDQTFVIEQIKRFYS